MKSARPLTIDVYELARERGAVEGDLALDTMPRLALSLLRTDGVLRFQIRGQVDPQGHPAAEMQLHADLALQCQRCSDELRYELRRTARFSFVASEEELAKMPIVDDDIEIIVGSRAMAVAPWVEDEAILSLPLVPRHDKCQLDYAVEATAVAAEADEPHPFAALAELRARRRHN